MYKIGLSITVLALVALLMAPATAIAFEGLTARTAGMGFGLSATPDDETAHLTNPAGLPHFTTFGLDVSPWPSRASATLSLDTPAGIDYYFGAIYAGRDAANEAGWGASFQRMDNAVEMNQFAVGYGRQLGPDGFSAGLSLKHLTNGGDATMVDLGLMYRMDLPLNNWRYGLVVRDLFDDSGVGPWFDLGASVELEGGAIVGATLFDVTDEIDSMLGIGGELPIPMSDFTVRAGLFDGDLSLGGGYRWANFDLSLSWQDLDGGDLILVTGTGSF